MGIGLVFYGMGLMSEAMTPMRGYPSFLEILVRLENSGSRHYRRRGVHRHSAILCRQRWPRHRDGE